MAHGLLDHNQARSSQFGDLSRNYELRTQNGDHAVSLGTILLIVLVIALLGGFSGLGGGPFYGTGYYGGGGIGLVLVVVLVLVVLGRI
jgi:hypothetical protein